MKQEVHCMYFLTINPAYKSESIVQGLSEPASAGSIYSSGQKKVPVTLQRYVRWTAVPFYVTVQLRLTNANAVYLFNRCTDVRTRYGVFKNVHGDT